MNNDAAKMICLVVAVVCVALGFWAGRASAPPSCEDQIRTGVDSAIDQFVPGR